MSEIKDKLKGAKDKVVGAGEGAKDTVTVVMPLPLQVELGIMKKVHQVRRWEEKMIP